MSEARTPEEDTITRDDASTDDASTDDDYGGPDPEEDKKGDASDEDQGT